MDSKTIKRIRILGIPIDVVHDEGLSLFLDFLNENKKNQHIILLDFHEFMKSLFHLERKKALNNAALVIPTSKLLVFAARFVKKEVPPLRHSYPFIMRLLGLLEQKKKSIYILGSTMSGIHTAESTLRMSFPELQIVGRYSAQYSKNREQDLVTAIKKASPTLLLTSGKIKGRHLWIYRHRQKLSYGCGVWEKYCFDVFSGKRKKPRFGTVSRLIIGFFSIFIMPWRVLRIFRYMAFFLLIVIQRIRHI